MSAERRAVSEGFAPPPRGGMTWTLAGERLGLLAWPRAILLQLAHPLVAAGVGDHSGFRHSRLAPYERLHATVTAMRRLTFGAPEEAAAALQAILSIHDRVHGTLREPAGPFDRGTAYSAHDPALLLWVHATLLDSSVRVLGELLGPFGEAARDGYCRETAALAIALGTPPERLPVTWLALQRYLDDMITGGTVAVSEPARALAPAVLRPPMASLIWPASRAAALITIGSLPESIRQQYGFPWTADDERRRARAVAMLRRLRRWAPARLARWPEARR